METIVNVYHVENAAFEKGDIEYGEPEEVWWCLPQVLVLPSW
jgi:hypothetical protein